MKLKTKNKESSKNIRQQEQHENSIFELTPDIFDLFLPDAFQENVDYIYLGPENYCRVYVLDIDYPSEMYVGFFDSLLDKGEIAISVFIEPRDTGEAIKDITRRINAMKSNAMLQRGEPDYKLLAQIEWYDALRSSLQRNLEKILMTQVFIVVYAKSLEKLKEDCIRITKFAESLGLNMRCLSFEQQKGFLSSLPLGPRNLRYFEKFRLMTTSACSCLFPIGNTDISYDEGFYIGYNVITNSPVFYNQFDKQLPNPHMAIFGTTGAGKSTTMKTMLGRMAAYGYNICVLDPEREYEKIINMLGGKYIRIKPGEKLGINPFDVEVEEEEGKRFIDLNSKVADIRFILNIISEYYVGRKLDGVQMAAIERIVRKLYYDRGITSDPDSLYTTARMDEKGQLLVGKIKKQLPTLSDLREELYKESETQALAKAMEVFVGEGSLALFDCQTTIDADDKIIAFDLKEFERDNFLKFFASVNILSWIWNKFSNAKLKGQKKVVIFDEAWMFTKYQASAEYLEFISRKGRKYKISLMIASQTLLEFLMNDTGRAIINMCASKFLMRQESDMAAQIAEFFRLSERTTEIITSADKGQGILMNPKEKIFVQITPFDFEWEYVTT